VRFCIIAPLHILGMILEQRDECNVIRYLSRRISKYISDRLIVSSTVNI
jgi:hypothetical protein